ncbi:MAG: hypothetical protein MUC99_00870 [Anaerolineae bacterium]|nr:hypothetical protein [Anaerolineae bacterium]
MPAGLAPLMWQVPRRGLALRWAIMACGVSVLVWSSFEDDRVWPVLALGVLCAGVGLAHGITGSGAAGRVLRGAHVAWAWACFGALTGGLGVFAAVLLMTFKDIRHAHPFPDYPASLLADTLARLPAWALAGAML